MTGQSAHGICGVCGVDGVRTKTHIPPRAAGNRSDLAMRRGWLTSDNHLSFGRPLSGGIWLFGLCASCNHIAGRFDAAYRDLAELVRPGVPAKVLTTADYRWRATSGNIQPGAIARSVLAGMFALNPSLRERFVNIATMLADQDSEPAPLPDDVRLRLAAFGGFRARVTGSFDGWYLRVGGNQRSDGVNTAASVSFRPLAWYLAYPDVPDEPPNVFAPLIDIERWADVSHWVAADPEGVVPLGAELESGLPVVDLPDRHPHDGWRWTWLLNDTICPIIDADLAD